LLGPENETVLGKIGARNPLDPRERVVRMHDRHNALPHAHLTLKAGIAWHVRQDADIDALIDDGVDDRCPVAHFDGDLDIWVKPMECGDQCDAGHGIAQPDAQFAAFERVVLPKNRQRLSLNPVQLRCDGNELPAQGGRHELAAAPLEEHDAEVIFQAADLLRDGRLRHAKPPRGPREATRIEDGIDRAHP
jgi:hypothetical protein